MNKYLIENKKKQCYGCRSCELSCPKKCIEMKEDDEGFLYPRINHKLCIECGICEKVCPYGKEQDLKIQGNKYIALINRDTEILSRSSSGGVFWELARQVIQDGGCVFGAYMDDFFNVKHGKAENFEELKKLQKSKYVQSDTNITYEQAKKILKAGRTVLYASTPCQIAGLRFFLNKKYENLLTLDLICHGVPSNLFFKEHINYLKKHYKKEIKSYEFRTKKIYGAPNEVIYFSDKKKYRNGLTSYFALAYNSAYPFRETCFHCPFADTARAGDITLGDFWGAEKYIKDINILKGVSLALVNTKKGEAMINKIKDRFILKEITQKQAVNDNGCLCRSTKKPEHYKTFLEDKKSLSYRDLAKKYFVPSHYWYRKMKLLIPIQIKFKLHKWIRR